MRLAGVGKRYGVRGAWVLRGVDLHLPRGGLVRVEGENGSGKSTLLRVVAGVCEPTTGRVTDRGSAAYVPERFPPDLPMTALRYLTHLGRLHGLTGRESAKRAKAWAERLDFGDKVREPLRGLSKGTCQKVALAQAFMAEPDLLVLDEAWTGLDAGSRRVLDGCVVDRVESGATVVFVDHGPGHLADEVTDTYRVEDGAVAPAVPAVNATRVVIDIETGPRPLLDRLPGSPVREEGRPGVLRLHSTTAHSDALLRHLLTAVPGVSVRAVHREGDGA
ncbi:ATP-binding cassette domain-containing protein [Embleya sp. NBC_00896]|uniref:ATP-binding cassette domain-containing protein n=1 Tax=Embleya sp. NBC_00896 TaxID=2975961 RepID=UPI00386BB726|nr:ABC transporter ATP-binding protein [Embleya sp. NBC_00896]